MATQAASLPTIVNQMIDQGAFRRVLLNKSAQFGRPARQYLGAQLLPERLVPNNSYTEMEIKFRTVVALDSSRYSTPQMRGNDIVGSMKVDLGDQDIASVITSEVYDQFIEIDKLNSLDENNGNPGMLEAGALSNWFDQHINLGLIEKIEKMRWEALVDAVVPLRGDGGYSEDVTLPNPSGQRVAAGGNWTDPTYNPIDDVLARKKFMALKGYDIAFFAAGDPVIYTILSNPKAQAAVRGFNISTAGAIQNVGGILSPDELNNYLRRFGLPPIIPYNLQYRDHSASHYFLKRDVLVGVALTGRDMSIDLGDNEILPLFNTLGYVGIGRAAGQAGPGRASYQRAHEDKPPRAEFQGWQTSFPVVQDVNAVTVINGITTS